MSMYIMKPYYKTKGGRTESTTFETKSQTFRLNSTFSGSTSSTDYTLFTRYNKRSMSTSKDTKSTYLLQGTVSYPKISSGSTSSSFIAYSAARLTTCDVYTTSTSSSFVNGAFSTGSTQRFIITYLSNFNIDSDEYCMMGLSGQRYSGQLPPELTSSAYSLVINTDLKSTSIITTRFSSITDPYCLEYTYNYRNSKKYTTQMYMSGMAYVRYSNPADVIVLVGTYNDSDSNMKMSILKATLSEMPA